MFADVDSLRSNHVHDVVVAVHRSFRRICIFLSTPGCNTLGFCSLPSASCHSTRCGPLSADALVRGVPSSLRLRIDSAEEYANSMNELAFAMNDESHVGLSGGASAGCGI